MPDPLPRPDAPDRPSLTWRIALAALGRLPQGLLSRVAGWLADRRLPRALRSPVLGLFARIVGADTGEAAEPLAAYPSLNAFFVRRLQPGARAWPDEASGTVASPVDGVVGRFGTITRGTLVQAKGRDYTVGRLLADADRAGHFEAGSFVTVYLAPRHYHRIHAPVTGDVTWARHVPGALWPVNRAAVDHVEDLFVRNERLIAAIETSRGPVAVVAVGAYNVGRISAAFDPAWGGDTTTWITNRRASVPSYRAYEPPVSVSQGDEFMAFHLGSTVILLLPPGTEVEADLTPGLEVRAGRILARMTPSDHLAS